MNINQHGKRQLLPGLGLASVLAVLASLVGQWFPLLGGSILSLLFGLLLGLVFQEKGRFEAGIALAAKKPIQYAVILLGFGLDLTVLVATGGRILPILALTITTTLLVAFIGGKVLRLSSKTSSLIGVGTAICGGSAIAATAPVIDADQEEITQAMAVVFLCNLLAALFFPSLGKLLHFSSWTGEGFGIFAGTAINDASSVTATAAVWDQLHQLGSQTLDVAVMVKLIRTVAIVPVTLLFAFLQRKAGDESAQKGPFPIFILYFLAASLLATWLQAVGFSLPFLGFLKACSRFLIALSMAAIGLQTNLKQLVTDGRKSLLLGLLCWGLLIALTLLLQAGFGYW